MLLNLLSGSFGDFTTQWRRTTVRPGRWRRRLSAPATVGLDRGQARALVAAAADTGAQALRTAAVVRLLLHNALRVDEESGTNWGRRLWLAGGSGWP